MENLLYEFRRCERRSHHGMSAKFASIYIRSGGVHTLTPGLLVRMASELSVQGFLS